MKVFAISDLHLPSRRDKTQDMFGDNWLNHSRKIRTNWLSKIGIDDLVLVPGDISWAMKWDDADRDLEYLSKLPGIKIISEGNHDYWLFNKRNKKKQLFIDMDNEQSKMRFIHNDSFSVRINSDLVGIAAIKGWSHSIQGIGQDEKLIQRQLGRLERSIQSIPEDASKMIIMVHYPPSNRVFPSRLIKENKHIFSFERYDERFWEMIKEYNPSAVVFGHLHNVKIPVKQQLDGINVYCVSADVINFDPVEVKI